MFEQFQAGYRHTVEEQERKRREILQSPSTAPGWGEIDLDSGVVTIFPSTPSDTARTGTPVASDRDR